MRLRSSGLWIPGSRPKRPHPTYARQPGRNAYMRDDSIPAGDMMCERRITVQQTGSPIRRHWKQRVTLIGLGLNKINRQSDLPDNPTTRGMIAKVAHMVRIIHERTELDCFVEAVRAEYW